jgi:mono/diheme cytochrome c family protein
MTSQPDAQPVMRDAGAPPPEQTQSTRPPPPYKATMEPGGVTIPLDERVATSAATPPPPISGGTLLVTHDGAYAVAADPDRDRVSIVELAGSRSSLHANIALEPGDEPGRLTEDDSGRVHVALRRAGMVASIDVAGGTLLARRPVCAAPRGIAFDASTQTLLIACAGGALMQLPANPDAGDAFMRTQLGPDLRDVLIEGDRTFVSRFKRAELFVVPADGTAGALDVPNTISNGGAAGQQLAPEMAWRFTRASDGTTYLLHQGARTDTIDVDPRDGGNPIATQGPYGAGAVACAGVVQSEVTVFANDGVEQISQRLPGVLPVDFALDERSSQLAVVFAGAADGDTPPRTTLPFASTRNVGAAGSAADPIGGGAVPPPGGLSVMVFNTQLMNLASAVPDSCIAPIAGLPKVVAFEPVAVAVAGDWFAVQTREPAYLILTDMRAATYTVYLEGDSVADTGHTLFHHDAGGGVACASCHAEGGEDGHVWKFSDSGERRTQALNVGLAGTAPFHWAGDMPGIPELMEEVLVHRMGGVHETMGRTEALEQWLFSLQPPAPLRAADDPAAVRGRTLFAGRAECSKCHSGEKLTNNRNEDVGTGGSFQVPSLIGVGSRGPWLHTGCASTLRDRFDPKCGGDEHGQTADLSDAEIDDLVAYLESL